jgi:hypothetical protein
MASDISLAVGDGARRMTYVELAQARGISPASAKRLTQRHRWGRQVGNDGVVRVTVPLSVLVNTTKTAHDTDSLSPATGATSPATPITVADDVVGDVAADVIDDVAPATNALVRAIEALREQLAKADQREELVRRRAEHAERRIDELQDELTRERCRAVAVQRKLIEVLTGPRVPWWRRWFR